MCIRDSLNDELIFNSTEEIKDVYKRQDQRICWIAHDGQKLGQKNDENRCNKLQKVNDESGPEDQKNVEIQSEWT